MKVMVTGATGFVGSWLVKNLVKAGIKVRVLHRPNSSLAELEGLAFESFHGDVTDRDSVLRASKGMETVFHLAGVVGYSKAMRNQMDLVNVRGTQNVVDAIKESPSTSLVFMSSVVAVGASFDGKNRLNEESPYTISHLDLGYFETKKAAEEIVKSNAKLGKIKAVIVNPSTVYGPADAKKGSRKIQVKVARGEFPFYTSGGVSVISIHDLIPAVLKAWQHGRNGERYILSGDNITIKQVFDIIAARAGVKPPAIYLPNGIVKTIGRVGDVLEQMNFKGPLNTENAWTSILYHWFDNSKAKQELGLQTRSAAEAIADSVDWMKSHGLLAAKE